MVRRSRPVISIIPLVMPDIFLDVLNEDAVRVQPKSVHGMLWLQTHFEDDSWELLSIGAVGINTSDAIALSQDAELSGLHVVFPSPL